MGSGALYKIEMLAEGYKGNQVNHDGHDGDSLFVSS